MWWCACAVRGVGGVVRCRAVLVRCWCPGAGAGAWLAVLLCPPPDESRRVRGKCDMQSGLLPAGGGLGSGKSTQAPSGLQLPPPHVSCLHAYSPACMPVCLFACSLLTCTHPRPRLHAHTHTHARTHARTHALAHTRTLARRHCRHRARRHARNAHRKTADLTAPYTRN